MLLKLKNPIYLKSYIKINNNNNINRHNKIATVNNNLIQAMFITLDLKYEPSVFKLLIKINPTPTTSQSLYEYISVKINNVHPSK